MAQSVQAMRVLAVRMLATGGVAALLATGAAAQPTPGSQQGLGLTGADVPPLLKTVRADPYRAPAEPACESIPQEILALNQVLGPDVDGEQAKTGKAHMAMNYARGMIPYHGYVRFLTRADSKDNALQKAVTAGVARRAFLRGLEAHMQCARPSEALAADTKVADASARMPLIEPGAVETVPLPASELKVAKVEAETVEVADARPMPRAGDQIAKEMLTPARAESRPAPPVEARASEAPAHVTYRLIDSVSGRPIVPDEQKSGPADPTPSR
jgi:hypothetical protein